MNEALQKIWNVEELRQVPAVYDAPGFCEDGVRALFYENVEWRGRPTRAFAWYGCPADASAEKPVPGIVLVHGGGGTALADWVRVWNAKGYAAIAMDNCGGVPAWSVCPYSKPVWPRHQFSGPAGWGNIHLAAEPPRDQWVYHAAASVLRARALLASFPEVQSDNIGVNGGDELGILLRHGPPLRIGDGRDGIRTVAEVADAPVQEANLRTFDLFCRTPSRHASDGNREDNVSHGRNYTIFFTGSQEDHRREEDASRGLKATPLHGRRLSGLLPQGIRRLRRQRGCP